MINPFKFILSYLLILKASSFQGKGHFKKTIELANKAKAYSPKSKIILKASYIFLCDDYRRIGMYDQAINETENALKLFHEEKQFHQLMVEALTCKGEPIEKAIPYIKKYLAKYEKHTSKFPKIMQKFTKNIDLDEYAKQLNSWNDEWAEWAQETLNKFESNKTL